MHALERVRSLLHDVGTRSAFANECDGLDVRVPSQGPSGCFAESVHDIEHAFRKPRFFRDFDKKPRRQRSEFGRLVDNRASGGQRGGDFPGREHERRVPRRNNADRANRNSRCQVHERRRVQRMSVASGGSAIREKPEILRSPDCRLRHETNGLSRVPALAQGNLFGPFHNQVRDPVKDLFAFRARQISPFRKRLLGGLRSQIHVVGIAHRDFADCAAVHRRRCREPFSGDGRLRLPCNLVEHARFPELAQMQVEFFQIGRKFAHFQTLTSITMVLSFGLSSGSMSRISIESARGRFPNASAK